jgi:uncharacterized protein
MKIRFLSLALLAGLLFALPALAMDLHEARSAGQVAEKLDGYVTALKPSTDVQALVSSVNAERKQEYIRISKEKGQPVDVVAKLAAQQIINNLPAGSTYQAPDGGWKKR